jgi:hypothetical protein
MWEFEGNVSLPNKGTSVKILQHVPSEAPISVSEIGIRVRDDEIYIEPPEQKWNSIRGLPDHLDVALAKIGMEA